MPEDDLPELLFVQQGTGLVPLTPDLGRVEPGDAGEYFWYAPGGGIFHCEITERAGRALVIVGDYVGWTHPGTRVLTPHSPSSEQRGKPTESD
jgi:hypothetical protein